MEEQPGTDVQPLLKMVEVIIGLPVILAALALLVFNLYVVFGG